MLSQEVRVERVAKALRSRAGKDGWVALKLPVLGTVYPHVIPTDFARANGFSEVWVRVGSPDLAKASHEFRGSAEMVAQQLCALLLNVPAR